MVADVILAGALNHSGRSLLVADAMKHSRRAPVRIGHLAQIDVFVTDQEPPPEIVEICRDNEVRIELATSGQAALSVA